MSSQIATIFARAGEMIMASAQARWPESVRRLIHTPFPGIGLATRDLNLGSYGQMERMRLLAADMYDVLAAWSRE